MAADHGRPSRNQAAECVKVLEGSQYVINRSAVRWLLAARVILGTLFLASALGLQFSGSQRVLTFGFEPIYLYAGAIYLSSAIIGYYAGSRNTFGVTLTTALSALDLTLVFGLTTFTGGSNSPFLFLYLFIIIGAAILRLRRGALVMTALSMTMLGGTFVLEYYGRLPRMYLVKYDAANTSQLLIAAFYNITAFYVVGILSSYLAERLRTAGEQIDQLDLDISILKGLQQRIIENVASGLLTLDELGRILLSNRQAERVLGFSSAQLLGVKVSGLLPGLSLAGTVHEERMEIDYRHPDGGSRFLGYSVSSIRIDPRRLGFIVVFQDLTRMKELEVAVKRQEKLAALGSMAAGIAHEIRNPLGSISGSLQLLRQQDKSAEEENRQLIEIALREIDRLNSLINDFLVYAKPVRREMWKVHPAAIIVEIIDALANDPKTEVGKTIENSVPSTLTIWADSNSLKQVLLNLVLNAFQAGASTVAIKGIEGANSHTIEVIDNGKGIPAEVMPKLFDPFFSTRADGVGLGLSIVYRIMEESQGTVLVESKPGRTVFRLSFPVHREA